MKKDGENIHTPTLNLKSAACLALVGTAILMARLLANFIFDALNILHGLIPATRLFTSFIYTLASVSVVVFLYAFHKAQS